MKTYLPTIAFVTPFLLFFIIPSLVPHQTAGIDELGSKVTTRVPSQYTTMIAARVALMGIAIGVFWRFYLRSFPLQVDRWGLIAGLVGGALWIGLCQLQIETSLLRLLGLPPELLGAREGVNPYAEYPEPAQRMIFLGVRFALLVIAVPIAEELFLRGFFMRVMDVVDWTKLPLAEVGTSGLVAGTLYGLATHPSEFVAAAAWFSLVSWLMIATGKFWNCVLAHAVTNLMLGVYVLVTGTYRLW